MPALGSSAEEVSERAERGADEVDLVRRAQLGSAAAFEQLVLIYGDRLHRFLALRLRNESDARDAFQETLAAAWQGLPKLKGQQKFWPWIVGIAIHKAADEARRRTTDELDPEQHSYPDESLFEIRDALDSLPAQHREVLLLRYGLQFSEEEAAEVLGVRLGTVKSRCARARRALTEALR